MNNSNGYQNKSEKHDSRQGYIQAAIAKKANMAPCKLSQIINLERRLEANEMFALCEAIGVTPMKFAEYKSRLPEIFKAVADQLIVKFKN